MNGEKSPKDSVSNLVSKIHYKYLSDNRLTPLSIALAAGKTCMSGKETVAGTLDAPGSRADTAKKHCPHAKMPLWDSTRCVVGIASVDPYKGTEYIRGFRPYPPGAWPILSYLHRLNWAGEQTGHML